MEQGPSNLEAIRLEFWDLKEANRERDPGQREPHLEAIDPNLISEEEAGLWEEFQDMKSPVDMRVFREHLQAYRSEMAGELAESTDEDLREHRKAMLGYIAAEAQSLMLSWSEEQLRESPLAAPEDKEEVSGGEEPAAASGSGEEEVDLTDTLEDLIEKEDEDGEEEPES